VVAPTICDTVATSTTVAPSATSPTAEASPDSVAPGDDTSISGGGFTPGESLDFTLCSTPVGLGSVTADQAGDFLATVTIPAGTAAGTHTVVVQGQGSSRIATATITVVAASTDTGTGTGTGTTGTVTGTGALSRTGAEVARMAWLAALAVILGLWLVRAARRTTPWSRKGWR
jgi:hypothetical protein